MQEQLRLQRISGEADDTIIFCQHPPVYTVGKQDCSDDYLSTPEEIARDGIEVVNINRGGRITYHGPGQLVVYFIVKVTNFSPGVKDFVGLLSDICIDMVRSFGFAPSRKEGHPGIWLGDRKIVAIGLNISRGVSMHGVAINCLPDPLHTKHIIPCGIRGFGITSLAEEARTPGISIQAVKEKMLLSIEKGFGCSAVYYAALNVRSEDSAGSSYAGISSI